MAILPILCYPDPRLHKVARPIAVVDDRIRTLVSDMLATMYDAHGIGLAATQVDVHERLVVIDVSEDKSQPLVFINPEIEVLDPELSEYDEGCLSVPGFRGNVWRYTSIRVQAFDRNGETIDQIIRGMTACTYQHEVDHLDGLLFMDKVKDSNTFTTWDSFDKFHHHDFVVRVKELVAKFGS